MNRIKTGTRATWKASAQTGLSQGLETAILAVSCYITASWIPFLHETYWAPTASVVVLYPGSEATKKASLERFLGTAIGSLVGWAGTVWWNQNVLLYGLAVLIAVGICYLLRLENASRLCAV